MSIKIIVLSLCCGILAMAQAPSCSGLTLGLNVASGGSFNGFRPLASNSEIRRTITSDAVDSRSTTWLNTMGVGWGLLGRSPIYLTDSWGDPWDGLEYYVVGHNQPRVNVSYSAPDSYPIGSDPGPFPIPSNPCVEGGCGPGTAQRFNFDGDKVLVVIDRDSCLLYELWNVYYTPGSSTVVAGTGAVFDLLAGDHQRPYYSTAASVSGIPILATTIRPDEIAAGVVTHAIGITSLPWLHSMGFVGAASHHQYGGSYSAATPPFGSRLRLKANVNPPQITDPMALIILQAMKDYGMILLDGGININYWEAASSYYNSQTLLQILGHDGIPGISILNDLEFVEAGDVYCDANEACGHQPALGPAPAIISFIPSKTRIWRGTAVTLTSRVSNIPTRLRFITPDVGPVVADATTVTPTATTTYTLMVQNAHSSVTETATVEVPVCPVFPFGAPMPCWR